jgi:hypothetical protein
MDTLPGALTFPRSRATSWCSAVPVNRGMCPPSINTFLPSYIYSMGTDNYLQILGYSYLYIYRLFTYQKNVIFVRVMLVYWLVPHASHILQHFHARIGALKPPWTWSVTGHRRECRMCLKPGATPNIDIWWAANYDTQYHFWWLIVTKLYKFCEIFLYYHALHHIHTTNIPSLRSTMRFRFLVQIAALL